MEHGQAGQEEVPCSPNRAAVLIVDELELRRAGFASIVELCARAENLAIDTIAPTEIDAYAAQRHDLKLIILSVGGASLSAPQIHDLPARLMTLFPGTPCAVISDRTEAEEAIMAAKLCLLAFLPTNMEAELARHALTFVLAGGTYFPREALLQSAAIHAAGKRSQQAHDGEPGQLTPRQHAVLQRLGLGQSNKRIARDLSMQESTVKVHVRQIMSKLGAANRTQAALLAASVSTGQLRSDAPEAPPTRERLDEEDAES